MKIFIHPGGDEFGLECHGLARQLGFGWTSDPAASTVAIAPLLRRRLTDEEWAAPVLGTLIFHPSALPYRRGPDAIKHAIAAGERVSAATWFWCNGQLDAGDICEQELVLLLPGERPRDAFEHRFKPAALRALQRALAGVAKDDARRIRQDERLATYDGPYARERYFPTGIIVGKTCG